MLDKILKNYEESTYDFREFAYKYDPMAYLFSEWVNYYRMKWAIAKALRPRTILEIGVRYGYSARAFLEAVPDAEFTGIDADIPEFGGQSGAVEWAGQELSGKFNITLIKENSRDLEKLPGKVYDLIHVDGQQDGDGTFNDLDLAVVQGRHILVDGYYWSRANFLSVNEWLWLNKSIVDSVVVIPGYAGECLIKINDAATGKVNVNRSEELESEYTKDYYLKDCGGYAEWRRTDGKGVDPRLQVVADVGLALCHSNSVIDLGAGRGEVSRIFALQGKKVTAVDYSEDAVNIIQETLRDIHHDNITIVRDSVLNEQIYDEAYDLAVAADIIEHLSPEEDDVLYELVSRKLKPRGGVLVIHTAPNLWCYRYEHRRQQAEAKRVGFWLPRTRRTWYERLMHVNEQNPRVLKKQLLRYFPHVLLWFPDHYSMGGSLVRKFGISDMRRAQSIFAVASHEPIDETKLINFIAMLPIENEDARNVSLQIEKWPEHVHSDEIFQVSVILSNNTRNPLSSLMPNPVHLSYHWLDNSGDILVYDGLRTALPTHLLAQHRGIFGVQVKAPKEPKEYRLRILPVQEGVRWFEGSSCGGDLTVTVQGC